MKTKSLLLGTIFVILGFVGRGQVYQMYYQGFETTEPQSYYVVSSAAPEMSSVLHMGGERSIKLLQSATVKTELITDTIDFTQNASLRYVVLEFDHITNLATNSGGGDACKIYVKLASQDDNSWTQLLGTEHYNRTETYSSSFVSLSSFSKNSYTEWSQTTMTNEYWKHERFDINNILTSSVPVNYRKLIFKFEVVRKVGGSVNNNTGWWLDNIRVRASQNQIIAPNIEMVLYPDGGAHPNSRGARIELAATTTLQQGINDDSVYVVYKVGSDSTEHRIYMSNYMQNSPVFGNRKVYRARIPFEGYDTLMQFYCVVKDNTTNFNERTFPKSAGTWIKYWCVRDNSRASYTPVPENFSPMVNYSWFPFPEFADNKAEYVYDSATLRQAGYGPGAITDLRFLLGQDMLLSQARTKFQVRMKNAPADYTVNQSSSFPLYTSDYMQVVYDSTYVIGVGSAGSEKLIHLKDTFYYAGKDIILQTIYDCTTNPVRTMVKTMPTATGKPTIFYAGMDAGYGANPYTDQAFMNASDVETQRPVFLITQHHNQPLVYDAGVSELIDPNYNTPITSVPAQITVQLKNYGAATINGVRISYRIVTPTTADTIVGYYDWTGTLASMATTPVVIATGITLPAGYHELCAWTEDSITVSGTQHFRDHEPLNNEKCSSFIVCNGPLNGVRNIGGPNADYTNIEEFLFSLSRCGINDSLVVRLAPGSYPPFKMPVVSGLTQQHYIVFCPQSGPVSIYSDDTYNADTLVNLDLVSNIRFRDITFTRRSGSMSYMVALGMNSDNCRFDRCTFVDSLANVPASLRISALLHSGFADNLRVKNCTFVGGIIGVNLVGQAVDSRSTGNRVEDCLFRMQNNNAVATQYLSNVTIKGNEMYDVTGNTSYVLLVFSCHDTVNILANKIYTSHGAGAIGVSDVFGTSSRHAFIANNMIVCNDDGSANQLTTPLNIIQGNWIDVVYNSVKLTAPSRYSIAAATFGGGGTLSNSRFMNNIVASFDQVNYAFNLNPSSSNSNTINHNIYYSEGYTLNRRSPGGAYSTLAAWQNAVPSDNASQSFNPGFLNGSLVDLRTFNRLVKGVGTPIAGITTDMFDTVRNATAPCPGAFEFVSLLYDFEIEALLNPTDNCNMPSSVEMVVRLRNNGVNSFTPGGSMSFNLGYSVNGGAPQTFAVTIPVPDDDTVTYSTGRMLSLPAGAIGDSIYYITVWSSCANDPNQTNDTSVFTVVSHYHEPAANTVNANIPYATRATLIPTSGVINWPLYNSTAAGAPTKRGTLYWYHHVDDNEPFFCGDTLVTDTLRNDTTIYFMQHREIPMVRITQVQLKLGYTQGLTTPQPIWMFNPTGNNAASTPVLAVQLTNLGNDTAYLQGNKLYTVSPTSNINNKAITFGNTVLLPGQSIVVQYASGSASAANAAYTVHTGSLLATNTNLMANLGLLYKEGNNVVDAVALNGVISTSTSLSVRWANQNVPAYVWSGDAKQISNDTVGGIYRVAFNGNASDWVEATVASPMFIDRIDNSWIRYAENGCQGDLAQAVVTLQAPPTADIALFSRPLAEGCNLGMEDVSVYVRNYGTQPVSNLVLNYNAGGSTVSETLTTPVAAAGDTVYTFLQHINMAVANDSMFNVRIWASGVSGDTYHANDTCWTSALAQFTPATPIRPSIVDVAYAEPDTITIYPGPRMIPVWYDNNMNPVDTAHTFITDILYADETIGVAYLVADSSSSYQVGTGTTVNGNTAFPSPYQAGNKHAKQQFIYSASDLRAQGMEAGPIWKIAFYLDAFLGTASSVSFDDYSIAMGLTSDTIFANTSDWKNANVVYSRTPFVLQSSSAGGWVEHVFDAPFVWDGVSSVVVQVAYDLTTKYTSGIKTRYTTKNNTTLHKNNDNVLAANTATIDYIGAGSKDNKRPNIQFGSVKYGCISGVATTTLHLIGVPNSDARVYWPEGSDTIIYNNCGAVAMDVNVRNLGLSTLDGFKLKYYLDNQPVDSVVSTTTLVGGALTQTQLFSETLEPGRHTVVAVVEAAGDSITSNDTIVRHFMVRFCGGNYSISATDPTADYSSIGEVVDTLTIVGIDGPVVFNIASGTYNEQILLQSITGSSSTNTVTFRGETDSTVLVTFLTTAAANYVLNISGASNIIVDQLRILSVPATITGSGSNNANAVSIGDAENITFRNSSVKVSGTVNNTNASCFVLQDNINNLTVENCNIDSGYYSFKNAGTTVGNVTSYNFNNFTFQNNRITGFWNRGFDLIGVTNINISSNVINSGVNVNSRGLVGIYLQEIDSSISIQKNYINLIDDRNGGKVGIYLKNVVCSPMRLGMIVNNMISGVGTGTSGSAPCTNPSGMFIDDGCQYLSIYYNTMRISAGLQSNGNGIANTRGLLIQGANTHHIQVMNNIIANASKSYAYYVNVVSNVSVSDYNDYFSEGPNLAKWGVDCATLTDLQATNSKDVNSLDEEPYFASEADLHLIKNNFAAKAQYNTDVIEDIDGTIRPQIPAPTIGAHEVERLTHNLSVIRILEPTLPKVLTQPNNIESDSIKVKVEFYNNGTSTETNVMWYAYLEGYEGSTTSVTRNLGTFFSNQQKTDSVLVPTQLGIIDTHLVRVVLLVNVDDDTADNQATAEVYLAPAFDIKAENVHTDKSGCDLQQTVISITLKNVGFKDIPAGVSVQIGYHAQAYSPSYQPNNPTNNMVSIPTMPDTVIETHVLANSLDSAGMVVLTFDSLANLYPTDTVLNIKVRLTGWAKYIYDVNTINDETAATPASATSPSPVIDAFYTPASPVGRDTTFNYGTWGVVNASQVNSRPIRWYRDSTAAPFFPLDANGNIVNNYNTSRVWNTTPQYFHDSTYYLLCLSDKGCSSYFSPVTVHVAPQKAIDAALETVLAPLGNRVYMENDTVRVRIANYGTTPLTGIPITYALRKGNNTNPIQVVTETYAGTLAPNQTYVYTFDSLLHFNNPLQGANYQLRVWTDIEGDGERRNDTLRWVEKLRPSANNNTLLDYPFSTLPESTYPSGAIVAESNDIDIIRFSFNEIDLDLPPLGRTYTPFATPFSNPEWPVLHLKRGTADTMLITITSPTTPNAIARGKVAVYIDFNRNGDYGDAGECVVMPQEAWFNARKAFLVAIPNNASYGYMRMRVVASNFETEPAPVISAEAGHVIDFLLFIDSQPPAVDLAFTQIVAPRSYLIRNDSPVTVSFRMANKGTQTISSAQVKYRFITKVGDSLVFSSGDFNWSGNLASGRSTIVELPQFSFPLGTTTVRIWHTYNSDENPHNDTLLYEYHRFHTITLTMNDSFDSLNYWYAPTGYNSYTRNYWQCGTPSKTNINMAFSEPNAWVTDLTNTITSGRRGNVSYLYSPIINIAQIRPDTISFRLQRHLQNNSNVYVEFYNYANQWQKLDQDTLTTIVWYNDVDNHVFNGTSTGNSYNRYWISTRDISTDFNEKLQFRIVYSTPQSSNENAAFGEGCAVDDFCIGRAPRRIDVGVVDITHPTEPKYGQTIYPKVVVKNFGTDTAEQLEIGYIHYGIYLAKISYLDCHIAPSETDTFELTNPMVISSDFPDTFAIKAFTINNFDLYRDNDSVELQFALSPLEDDISAYGFVTPLDRVIAGDSVSVTMRIRNFGLSEITNATLSYIVNGVTRIDEEVDFVSLIGRPLMSMEFFNYTFHQRFRAAMGIMNLQGIVKDDHNDYIYNDTIFKRVEGISSITDIAAASVVVDTSSYNYVKVQLVIENRGARGANNFQVGFWYDNDTSTLFTETYWRDEPLAALSTGYHTFSIDLDTRPAPWEHFVGFVHIDDDNDPSNDTTTEISRQYVDIEVLGLIVEENAAPDCRVFIQMRNIGNLTLSGKTLQLRANINDSALSTNVVRTLAPGHIVTIEFNDRIPKDHMRHYVGSGRLTGLSADRDQSNNQTTNVTVVNYIEGMPTVNAGHLVLDQNYPNPFSGQTVVPFSLPEAGMVRFFVMDAMGKMVNSFERFFQEGDNTITLDMEAYSSGIYYYGIEVDGQRQMRKMILR